MKKIYLAIPYTGQEEKSFHIANGLAAKLMNEGYVVYSPITHAHPIKQQEQLPGSWEFWKRVDTEFIKWCDALYVCTIHGWDKSVGVTAELEIARELKKEIKYI